jgi:competence transcription factor ComK
MHEYGSPLPAKQTGQPLTPNERTKRHLKRIVGENPFASFKETNVELANLDVFICMETLWSYVARLNFKKYKTDHKLRMIAKYRKRRLRWDKEHLN